MAQQTHVQYIDDLDGTELGDHANVIAFGFGGKEYEIDLSDENAEAFRDVMARYIEAGRRTSSAARRPARKSSAKGSPGNTKAMREWARRTGFSVAGRGRIPPEVMSPYPAAHRPPGRRDDSVMTCGHATLPSRDRHGVVVACRHESIARPCPIRRVPTARDP